MISSQLKTRQIGENSMKSLAESSLNTSPLKDELKAIAHEITTLLPGADVILFGSYARGEQRKWSDLDLCVVADEYPMRLIDMMGAIYDVIDDKTEQPLDLLLFHRQSFAEHSMWKPTIEYTIAKEGVRLNG